MQYEPNNPFYDLQVNTLSESSTSTSIISTSGHQMLAVDSQNSSYLGEFEAHITSSGKKRGRPPKTKTTHPEQACPHCFKVLPSVAHLERHVRIHTGERPFACNLCDKRFTEKSGLERHLRVHTGERPYGCDQCDKRFSEKSGLDRHRIRHSGVKSFKCDLCDRTFYDGIDMRKHRRTHLWREGLGEEPAWRMSRRIDGLVHACPQCPKTFACKSYLNDHIAWMHERRRVRKLMFSCDVCQMKFKDQIHLDLHQRRTKGMEPLCCDFCPKVFCKRLTLNRHRVLEHGVRERLKSQKFRADKLYKRLKPGKIAISFSKEKGWMLDFGKSKEEAAGEMISAANGNEKHVDGGGFAVSPSEKS